MKRQRFPLSAHPLSMLFEPAVESVTTSLGDSSVTAYRGTVRLFLTYLGAHYSEVHSLQQLRRDPHILGWLALLRSHRPPLASITRANRVIFLRRLLEELAWTQHLPDLAHLLGRDDVPRKEHHLPRPLTPQQDELVQQELLRRDDLLSNALLLIRHTGMRIIEGVDLSFDCLRLVGPGQWAIHVPLGKLTKNGTPGSRGFSPSRISSANSTWLSPIPDTWPRLRPSLLAQPLAQIYRV